MKPAISYLTCFFLLSGAVTGLKASNDNYPAGARSAAMGGASVTNSDLWSVWHNQAALGFYPKLAFGFHHENRFVVDQFSLHAAGMTIPTGTGTFGLSYQYFGYSAYHETKLGVGLGKAFHERFAAGLQIDYFKTFIDLETGSGWTVGLEAGILAEPLDNLFIGCHIYNPTGAGISANGQKERIPTIFRLGMGYRFSEQFMLNLETEKDLDIKKPWYKAGLEYRIIEYVTARTGVLIGDYINHSFGLGFLMKRFEADVAFSYQQVLGYTPYFSLHYVFK